MNLILYSYIYTNDFELLIAGWLSVGPQVY